MSITRLGDRLTIHNVTVEDSGVYHCLATGNDGSVSSNPANVMVTGDVISCNGKLNVIVHTVLLVIVIYRY